MIKAGSLLAVVAVWVILLCGVGMAETYHLGADGDWQNVADTPDGEYLLAVSKIKQQLMSGDDAAVMEALEKLKSDFPDLAGAQIDAYIAAEQLYAEGKLYKSAVKYTQFLDAYPDSVLYSAAMERLFSIGVAYLQGEKRRYIKVLNLPAFDDGANLMRDIADREGNSPIALRALTTLADNQERRKDYSEAYETWLDIAKRWPTGNTGQDALLRMAQELHASYRGPQYDAKDLQRARNDYEEFIARFPEMAKKLNVQGELDMITEQLAYKQYETGFYYERTGKSDVAKYYYDRVLADWPGSKAAKMAQMRLEADAPPAVKQTKKRKLFDIGNAFLDSWFGVEKMVDKMMESQNQEPLE